MATKSKIRSNKAQIDYLCQYMLAHKEFAAGDFRTPQGGAQMERQWQQLQAGLDELGPHRSVEQWKICWRDQKRKARVEGGALNKAHNATGNSSVIPEISANSEMILNTIGPEMAIGCGPAESPIGFLLPSATTAPPPIAPTPTLTHTSNTQESPSSRPITPFTLPPSPSPARQSFPTQRTPNTHYPIRRRARVNHPSDRFLNAQLELNSLLKELVIEVRRSNDLKSTQNHLLSKLNRRRR